MYFRKKIYCMFLFALFLTSLLSLPLINIVQASTSLTIYVTSDADDNDTEVLPWGVFEIYPDCTWSVVMISKYSDCGDWFRFQSVNVPQGAIIESATLYVRAYADSASTTSNYRIQGFDEDNAAAPTGRTDWQSRPKTSAYKDVLLGTFVKNYLYSYSGLQSIVQEIVDRPGWASGNALVICSSADAYTFSKYCYSYEGANHIGDLTYAPRLYVRYSIPTHDVAVTEVTPYKTQATAGETLSISVTVENEGQAKETFDVTLYYDGNVIDTQTVTNLDPGGTDRLDFEWDTTGVAEGDYTIKAVAATVSGETDVADNTLIDGTVHVDVLAAPTASFQYSPPSPTEGETVSFDASASTDADGTIETYEWDWTNDGSYDQTVTSPTTTYAYPAAGTYTVKLRVTDNDGLTATYTASIGVSAPANTPPVADANGPYSGVVDESVAFSSSGSSDSDGSIVEYRWDFGDESGYSSDQNPSHAYVEAGTYTVSLRVKDDDDATHTDTTTCTVTEVPSSGAVITGVVTDETTGTPVGGATVTANGYTDTTGSDGAYSLSVEPGTYELTVSVSDYEEETTSVTVGAGESEPVDFTMTPTATSANGFPTLPVVAGGGAVAAVVAFLLLRRKPKEEAPRPAAMRITVDPAELLADGQSSSTITIELLDKDGEPMSALEDTEVRLRTTRGRVSSPVTIDKGQTSVKATLRSSTEIGAVQVSTTAKGLEGVSTTLTFVEKKRYCMHCGTRMPLDVKRCPKCGREPPSGVDVKACPNCGEIIPTVAQFCSNCGANQA